MKPLRLWKGVRKLKRGNSADVREIRMKAIAIIKEKC